MHKRHAADPRDADSEWTDIGRRNLLALTGAGILALGGGALAPAPAGAKVAGDWDKTFPLSDQVDHEKVTFTNRYGITLAGDLYLPKDRASRALPALAVAGPFGAVKEQSAGLYAQTMT